jgi:L,D-peptidoglycan transpeptidase YkuD (ErfK/YbiS/YcfS/YnhG family)
VLTLALALAVLTGTPTGCPQRIQVVAPSVRSTTATLTVRECGRRVLGPWRARVGRNGLSAHHREGDGTTPTGTYGIEPVLYGIDPDPGARLRYHHLTCGDWWDEDPRSPTYNTFRHVACGTRPPFGGGSEALWQITPAYRAFAVVGYNAHPVVPGRGSAIFLHVDTGRATNGCISLRQGLLLQLLRRLGPGATISVAQHA